MVTANDDSTVETEQHDFELKARKFSVKLSNGKLCFIFTLFKSN